MFSRDQLDANLKALFRHVADGNVTAAMTILDAHPTLVSMRETATTPSGLIIHDVTAFELSLGAGHPIMSNALATVFDKLPNGAKQRDQQYEKYKPLIENMLSQKPYEHFEALFNLIIDCGLHSPNDISQVVDRQLQPSNKLHNEIEKFRDYVKSCTAERHTASMHFNYNDIIEFFRLYDLHANKFSYEQMLLVSRQLFGLLMRNLTAYNRQVSARGMHDVVDGHAEIPETFALKKMPGKAFPVTAHDEAENGLGYDYFIDSFGFNYSFSVLAPYGSGWLWNQGLRQLQEDMMHIHQPENINQTKLPLK